MFVRLPLTVTLSERGVLLNLLTIEEGKDPVLIALEIGICPKCLPTETSLELAHPSAVLRYPKCFFFQPRLCMEKNIDTC